MKKLLFSLIALTAVASATAQQEPLVIDGKIDNCPERKLKIFFWDANNKMIIDTIEVNEKGVFHYETNKLTKPQRTSLQQNRTQINNIYVAPGYKLYITGNAVDHISLFRDKKITGVGGEVNRYRTLLDSLYAVNNDKTAWYELTLKDFVPFIKKRRAFEDSVARVVFSRPNTKDKHFNTFKRMVQLDNESMQFYYILQHIGFNKYSYDSMVALVKTNTPAAFAKAVSHDDYLQSEDYKNWVLPLYLQYLKQLDNAKDPSLAKQPNYDLNKINQAYNGKVKEQVLYRAIEGSISRGSSVEKLNESKKQYAPYLQALTNATVRKDLEQAFSDKEEVVMQMQVGKPAPKFTLVSNTGSSHSIDDFKGKVVYIDLWASWCAPCRAELPNFKTLYSKYKDNDKIAFMGIAVSDGEREWRKALEEEKPSWLQLYDKEGVVSRSYVANAIPKYILLDKNGHVVNFNAPGPGSAEIIKLIEQEIAK